MSRSSIHYRFKKALDLDYKTIIFDGPTITVGAVRDAIMIENHISKTRSYTIEISDAKNNLVLSDDTSLLSNDSYVDVERVKKSYQVDMTPVVSVNDNQCSSNTVLRKTSLIYYRFHNRSVGTSNCKYIMFDGPSITLGSLRNAIFEKNLLSKAHIALEISNAEDTEVLSDDALLLPKESFVIVKKVRKSFEFPCQIPGAYYSWRLFVGGLEMGTRADDVKRYFSSFGLVESVDMAYDEVQKRPKGFAYISFKNEDSISCVLKARHHRINGKTVEVKKISSHEQQLHQSRQQGVKQKKEPELARKMDEHTSEQKVSEDQETVVQRGVINPVPGSSQSETVTSIVPSAIPQVVNDRTQYALVQTQGYVPIPAAAVTPSVQSSNAVTLVYTLPPTRPFHPYRR